jgi:hypothetical protein
VSSNRTIDELVAEARYHRERISLLRAKAYAGGPARSVRIRELERALEHAERRLREARQNEST